MARFTRLAPAAVAVALLLPAVAAAQARPPGAGPNRSIRPPAEANQFDFLLGEWELTVTPKVSSLAQRMHGVPELSGTWTAWPALDGWGIRDEMRVVDDSGNPQVLLTNVRVYEPATRGWLVATVDAYRHRVTRSTTRWDGNEAESVVETEAHDGSGILVRTRFTRIRPDSFRYHQDRSTDGGESWDRDVLVIDARRVGEAPGA